MTDRDFRIIVRGAFDALTDDQRAVLRTEAAEHDVLFASFTREGHLSYDIAARSDFAFRFLESGSADEDIVPATARAEAAAESWLGERGYAWKNLRSTAQDMSKAALSKRQRKAQAAG